MADDKVPYHERYKAAPPPDYMRYLTAPFEGYWKRQGNLAREGLAMAEDGAQRARSGDMSGYLGAVLGPLNYLTSPINALLPEEQATRDFGRSLGGNVGETLAASGLGLAAIAMPGPDVGKGAKFADEAAEGITAYHGSPHTFDKFSMDKIGTGEGAQAYGHGLYFAENEAVAKGYRDTLTNKHAGNPAHYDGMVFPPSLEKAQQSELNALSAKMRKDGNLPQSEMTRWRELKAVENSYNDAVDAAKPKGSTYQVRLNVKPDELLDWDKPLSEQPKALQESVARAKADGMFPDRPNRYIPRTPQESEALKAAGVKGVRYKDAGSRDKDGGTYNYVIFDDSLVSILKRYAIPFTLGAGGAAIVSGANMPPELAAQMGPEA